MTVTIRVATVRSQRPGRTVFTGKAVDSRGQLIDHRAYYIVVADRRTLVNGVEPGQWWTVAGSVSSRSLDMHGFQMTEHTVEAQSAELERLSGENLISYMSQSPVFQGVGPVKARKLWNALGDGIYRVLDEADVKTLSRFLRPKIAQRVVEQWAIAANSKALKWLLALGLESKLARRVLEFHGSSAPERVDEDPYRLLSFSGSWATVDRLALESFGLSPNDERRLLGAIEEVCYRAFGGGDTCIPLDDVGVRVRKLLRTDSEALVESSIRLGHTNGAFVVRAPGIQPLGAAAMEAVVAATVSRLAKARDRLLPPVALNREIVKVERAQGFPLTPEQRLAVELANDHRLLLVTGGAGVGKTAALNAIVQAFQAAGLATEQLALAGRAAKRMSEATGLRARTIASFIHSGPLETLRPTAIVIDEASMVDLVSMARLLERAPADVRLVLLGDSHQLMPVGPGLTFHCLIEMSELPQVQLTSVKRHAGELLDAANRVRRGVWELPSPSLAAQVSFTSRELEEKSIAHLAVDLYMQSPKSTQILASKVEGVGGTKSINANAQQRSTARNPRLLDSKGLPVGINVGDPVLCVQNIWDRGLQNGSLGVVTEAFPCVVAIAATQDQPVTRSTGVIQWDDGIARPVDDSLIRALTLAYAITVHKAQGSQWTRVIVPVVESRNLDRAMLYTAMTRAQHQVVLLGDISAAQIAVTGPLKSSKRRVGLREAVLERLASMG